MISVRRILLLVVVEVIRSKKTIVIRKKIGKGRNKSSLEKNDPKQHKSRTPVRKEGKQMQKCTNKSYIKKSRIL